MKKSFDDQPYEHASRPLPVKKILLYNLIGGIAWAFGATIGLTIIVTILTIITKQINFIPAIGSFTSQIVEFVIETNPHLK